MYTIRKLAIVAFLSLCAPIQANAGLISADDAVFGVGSVTRDTTTGFEFLDLSVTRGLSYNQVQAQLGSTFAGWQIATLAQVQDLMVAGGLSIENNGGTLHTGTASELATIGNLAAFLGDTIADARTGFSAITGTAPFVGSHYVVEVWYLNSLVRNETMTALALGDHEAGSSIATFLVRSTSQDEVPVPGALSLMGFGVFGLSALRRRTTRD